MNPSNTTNADNPLGIAPVGSLLAKFAIPAIISMLVNALYNIVDQIFIGQGVRNARKRCNKHRISGHNDFNCCRTAPRYRRRIQLQSRNGRRQRAQSKRNCRKCTDNACHHRCIGCRDHFAFFASAARFLRSDRHSYALCHRLCKHHRHRSSVFYFVRRRKPSYPRRPQPTYSMMCTLTGAIINTILDPLFIFGFKWGIKGGAWATVIGQVVSAILVVIYFTKFRKMYLDRSMLKPNLNTCVRSLRSDLHPVSIRLPLRLYRLL